MTLQFFLDLFCRKPLYAECFVTRSLASKQNDLRAADIQQFRQILDQGAIGRGIHRRRSHTDLQFTAMHSRDLLTRCARLELDRQMNAVRSPCKKSRAHGENLWNRFMTAGFTNKSAKAKTTAIPITGARSSFAKERKENGARRVRAVKLMYAQRGCVPR